VYLLNPLPDSQELIKSSFLKCLIHTFEDFLKVTPKTFAHWILKTSLVGTWNKLVFEELDLDGHKGTQHDTAFFLIVIF